MEFFTGQLNGCVIVNQNSVNSTNLKNISVVIPAYNTAEEISVAINSVLDQICPVSEIIVVDDGSTDGTADLIRAQFPGVKYFFQENAGAGAARNRGIKESRGEWIAFLDADDRWYPRRIELQVKILQSAPEVFWCAGTYAERSIGEERFIRGREGGIVSLLNGNDGILRDFYQGRLCGAVACTDTMLIHRDVFSRVGFFEEALPISEDHHLWTRIAEHYPQIGYIISEPIAEYIRHEQSLTTIKNDEYPKILVKSALQFMTEESYSQSLKKNYLRAVYLKKGIITSVLRFVFRNGNKKEFEKIVKNSNGWIGLRWMILSVLIKAFPANLVKWIANIYYQSRPKIKKFIK